MSIFADTGAFLAYRNKKDKYHETALKLFKDALKGEYGQIYTSDYIYDESLTLALMRTKNPTIAMDIAQVIRCRGIKEEQPLACIYTATGLLALASSVIAGILWN
jgi:predicted nucleic acid-binding protein